MLSCLFVRDVLTNSTIPTFQNYSNKSENLHQRNTRLTNQNSTIATQRILVFMALIQYNTNQH